MSQPILSVIITSFSDADTANTVRSIQETAGDAPEIIVIDDGSPRPIPAMPGVRLIRNERRCGVGPSRHIGALAASGEMILIVDAHMRFINGWHDALTSRLVFQPSALICCTCLGLDANNMDVSKAKQVYHGGTINVLGPDRNVKHGRMQVLEAVWNRAPAPEDDAEICCCMGASYAMHRAWFLKIAPLHNLRSWGEDEIMLSVKTWLTGGSVRLHRGVQIGHRFRLDKERIPFPVPREDLLHNKLFALRTLLPPKLADVLLNALRRNTGVGSANRSAARDWAEIEVERAYNRTIFTRDFYWLAERFKLALPPH